MTDPSEPPIPDQLRPYLDIIADRLLSGHAAVMVGAGFSKNAASNFPDWSRLGDRFYERLHGHPSRPDVKYLQVPALAHLAARGENPALHRERRGARLTRREEGAYWAYATADCKQSVRTTQSGGMHRRSNAAGTFATGC